MTTNKPKKGLDISYKELSIREELPQLIVDMHLHGINVRYLLYLLGHVNSEKSKILIVTELVARSLKNFLRQKWRELKLIDLHQCYDDSPYKLSISKYFNAIFNSPKSYNNNNNKNNNNNYLNNLNNNDNDDNNDYFWRIEIPTIIGKQNLPLPPPDKIEQINLIIKNLRHWVTDHILFHRLQELLGLQIKHDQLNDGNFEGLKEIKFEDFHIAKIEPKIKYINRISFEEGTALSRLAMLEKDRNKSMALLEQACERYKETVAIRPDDTRALYNWVFLFSIFFVFYYFYLLLFFILIYLI